MFCYHYLRLAEIPRIHVAGQWEGKSKKVQQMATGEKNAVLRGAA
jgi:hypothetical protein